MFLGVFLEIMKRSFFSFLMLLAGGFLSAMGSDFPFCSAF